MTIPELIPCMGWRFVTLHIRMRCTMTVSKHATCSSKFCGLSLTCLCTVDIKHMTYAHDDTFWLWEFQFACACDNYLIVSKSWDEEFSFRVLQQRLYSQGASK